MRTDSSIDPVQLKAFWDKMRGRGRQEVFDAALSDGLICIAQQLWAKDSQSLKLQDTNFYGEGPLDAVARSGQIKSLEFLFACGLPSALFSQSDWRSRTPLMKAAMAGHVEMVQALLSHSNVEQTDSGGKTAFLLAIEASQWACADALAVCMRPERVAEGFKKARPERLPRWMAHQEREALSESLHPTEPAQSAHSSPPQPAATQPLTPTATGSKIRSTSLRRL